MRHTFLLLAILAITTGPAIARPIKDQQSPQLKQCVQSCKTEKDTTAHEGCLQHCVLDDAARQKTQSPVPPPSRK